MKIELILQERSGGTCELCGSKDSLDTYLVPPQAKGTADDSLWICENCRAQIERRAESDSAHWQCLTSSMWSEIPAVQVISWRMLNRFRNESWAADALDLLYLDEDKLAWAQQTGDHLTEPGQDMHRDSNGQILQNGDSVVLIKTLDVKGSSLSAKVGTVVKNIRLVHDNTEQIEGKVEGQTIVILTKYLRRNN